MKNLKELFKKNKLMVTITTGVIAIALTCGTIIYASNNNISRKVYSYDIEGNSEDVEVKGGKFFRSSKEFMIDGGSFKFKNQDLKDVREYTATILLEENGVKEYIYTFGESPYNKEETMNFKVNEEFKLGGNGGDGEEMEKKTLEMLDGKATFKLQFKLDDGDIKEYVVPLKLTETK